MDDEAAKVIDNDEWITAAYHGRDRCVLLTSITI
jgi:hypothetical protein